MSRLMRRQLSPMALRLKDLVGLALRGALGIRSSWPQVGLALEGVPGALVD